MYVQKETLLVAYAFEHFQNTYFEKYELDPARFYTAPRLAWQVDIKKDQSKIRSFNQNWYVINGRQRF